MKEFADRKADSLRISAGLQNSLFIQSQLYDFFV